MPSRARIETFSVVSITRPWQAAMTSQVGLIKAFHPGRICSLNCFTRIVLHNRSNNNRVALGNRSYKPCNTRRRTENRSNTNAGWLQVQGVFFYWDPPKSSKYQIT